MEKCDSLVLRLPWWKLKTRPGRLQVLIIHTKSPQGRSEQGCFSSGFSVSPVFLFVVRLFLYFNCNCNCTQQIQKLTKTISEENCIRITTKSHQTALDKPFIYLIALLLLSPMYLLEFGYKSLSLILIKGGRSVHIKRMAQNPTSYRKWKIFLWHSCLAFDGIPNAQ